MADLVDYSAMSMASIAKALEPCTRERAAEIGAILVGCYPRHSVESPEIYTRGIVSLIQEYPAAVAAKAVDMLTRECKYMPTRAELFQALEHEATRLRDAHHQAKIAQLEAARAEVERKRQAEVEAFRAKCLAETGKSPFDRFREILSNGGDKGKDNENFGPENADDVRHAGDADEPGNGQESE